MFCSNSSLEIRFGSLAFIGAPDVCVENGRLVSDMDICLLLLAVSVVVVAVVDKAHDSDT